MFTSEFRYKHLPLVEETKFHTHIKQQILHVLPRSKNAWSYTSTPPTLLYGVVLS